MLANYTFPRKTRPEFSICVLALKATLPQPEDDDRFMIQVDATRKQYVAQKNQRRQGR